MKEIHFFSMIIAALFIVVMVLMTFMYKSGQNSDQHAFEITKACIAAGNEWRPTLAQGDRYSTMSCVKPQP